MHPLKNHYADFCLENLRERNGFSSHIIPVSCFSCVSFGMGSSKKIPLEMWWFRAVVWVAIICFFFVSSAHWYIMYHRHSMDCNSMGILKQSGIFMSTNSVWKMTRSHTLGWHEMNFCTRLKGSFVRCKAPTKNQTSGVKTWMDCIVSVIERIYTKPFINLHKNLNFLNISTPSLLVNPDFQFTQIFKIQN